MTEAERRKEPRAAERVPLALSESGTALTAETKNLSASGVYCLLDRFIPPMTKLEIKFELPETRRAVAISCSGVVVRVEPVVASSERLRYHVALFFTDLAERDRSAIARFVRRRLAASDPAE